MHQGAGMVVHDPPLFGRGLVRAYLQKPGEERCASMPPGRALGENPSGPRLWRQPGRSCQDFPLLPAGWQHGQKVELRPATLTALSVALHFLQGCPDRP